MTHRFKLIIDDDATSKKEKERGTRVGRGYKGLRLFCRTCPANSAVACTQSVRNSRKVSAAARRECTCKHAQRQTPTAVQWHFAYLIRCAQLHG